MRQFWSMRWNFGQHIAQHLRFELRCNWLYSHHRAMATASLRAAYGIRMREIEAANRS
jgi:hypothetical protein